jgi:hypothetical protein
MRNTSDRLRSNMDEEAIRLANVAAGYRMAGDNELARKASYAAQALNAALNAVHIYQAAVAAATEEQKP